MFADSWRGFSTSLLSPLFSFFFSLSLWPLNGEVEHQQKFFFSFIQGKAAALTMGHVFFCCTAANWMDPDRVIFSAPASLSALIISLSSRSYLETLVTAGSTLIVPTATVVCTIRHCLCHESTMKCYCFIVYLSCFLFFFFLKIQNKTKYEHLNSQLKMKMPNL